MSMRARLRLISCLSVTVVAVACGDGIGLGQVPVVELDAADTTVFSDDAIGPTYRLWVLYGLTIRRNGVPGPISVTASASGIIGTPNLPPDGRTVLVSDDPAEEVHLQLNAQVQAGTVAGDYPVDVVVQLGRHRIDTQFVVRLRPIRLQLVARRVVLSRGATQRVALPTTRTGSAIGTASAITGLPAGVTASTATAGYIDLAASPDAALGDATVTLTLAAGSATAPAAFTLFVQDAAPKRAISFRMCWPQPLQVGTLSFHRVVAVANDGEGWQRVTPDAEGVVQVDATERVSVAAMASVMHNTFYAPGTLVRVMHATATELDGQRCPAATAPTAASAATPVVDVAANTITLSWPAEPPAIAGVGQRYTIDGRGVYTDVELWQSRGYAGAAAGGAWMFRAPDLAGVTSSRSWHSGAARAATSTF